MQENTNPPLRLLAAFQEAFPALSADVIMKVPGREMWVAASSEKATAFTIAAPDFEGKTTFNWRSAKSNKTILERPLPKWARFPACVIVSLCQDGLDSDGFYAVVLGEEPVGPRHEFSLGMAFAALLHTLNQQPYTAEALVEMVTKIQREKWAG